MAVDKTIFKGLEKRLTSARVERLKTIHEIDRLQIDIANLDREASEISTKVDELEAQMKAGKGEVMEVRKNMNHIEDKIFKEFCDRCEVKDIREFEQINIRLLNFFFFVKT